MRAPSRRVHRSRRRTAWAATLLLPASLLLTGCSGDGGCDRGATTVDAAVTGLLTAVADGDTVAAEQLLDEVASVDDASFDRLHAALDGVAIDTLQTRADQMGSRHAVEVVTADGTSLGTLEVDEDSGCAAVVWGIVPEQPTPAPGESQGASTD
jgi:hypothetical protein